MNKNLAIAIVGAGIGGLTTAIALRKQGFSPVIFEQAEELQPIGSGILLGLNAMMAFSKLGLVEEIIRHGSLVNSFHIQSDNGDILGKINFSSASKIDMPVVGITRANLHRVLLQAIPEDSLYLGHSFQSLWNSKNKVIIRFKNGKEHDSELVIAADGIHSIIRKSVLQEDNLIYSGYAGWRGLSPSPPNFPSHLFESWGVGKRFGAMKINSKQVYWYSMVNAPVNTLESDGLKARQINLDLFSDWHSPIKELIASTAPENIVRTDVFDTQPYKFWHKDSVVFVGDSIHPTTPNLGQGAGMAIESALVLARCLARFDNHDAAFRAYQASRVRRTNWISRSSSRLGRLGQIDSDALCYIRNIFMKACYLLLPRYIQQLPLRKLINYKIEF